MPAKKTIQRICAICGDNFLVSQYEIDKGRGKYCSGKCRSIGNIRPVDERFWAKVDKSNNGGCWIWIGGKLGRLKHGGFWDGKQMTYAHRVSYEFVNGPIPEGKEIMHICDNPACVNPNHLMLGSHAENMLDAKTKGRTSGGFHFVHEENRSLGEKHGQSKLTDNDIREIRQKYDSGIKVNELARQYGMGHAQIGMIAHRRAWIHIK